MADWTTTRLNLRYHWKALLIGGLGLIGVSLTLVAWATPYPDPWKAEGYPWEDECEEEGGCPTHYVIEGFDVWMSPTVSQAPDYTHASLGRDMDIIKAQLLWITSSDVLPPTAIQQLIDSGVSLYLDTPSEWSVWWPCGDWKPGGGCYNPGWNQVAVPVLGVGWGGRSWLQQDHTRQSMILHELAHAFHYWVISGGINNVCLA